MSVWGRDETSTLVSQQFSLLYLLQFSILSLLVRRSRVIVNGGAKCCCYDSSVSVMLHRT